MLPGTPALLLNERGGMKTWLRMVVAVVAVAGSAAGARPADAQETTLKGGVAISRLDAADPAYWDDQLTTTFFGLAARFRFGPIMLQPELAVVTKGAAASQPLTPADREQVRLEYIEIPALVVLPLRIGELEPFVYGGPSLMLESRCRWFVWVDDLRNILSCDPPRGQLFRRNAVDWGVVAGGGAADPIGPGHVSVEARQTWGMRNIHRDPGMELRNRTFSVLLGYSLNWEPGT
jgi:hypothetical protein